MYIYILPSSRRSDGSYTTSESVNKSLIPLKYQLACSMEQKLEPSMEQKLEPSMEQKLVCSLEPSTEQKLASATEQKLVCSLGQKWVRGKHTGMDRPPSMPRSIIPSWILPWVGRPTCDTRSRRAMACTDRSWNQYGPNRQHRTKFPHSSRQHQ